MAIDDGWKVRQDESGHEFGPFEWARIVELARNGRILPEYRLFHAEKTKGTWVKAGRVSLLMPIFEQLAKESGQPASPSAESQPTVTQPPPKPPAIHRPAGETAANAAASPQSATASNPYDNSMEDIYTAPTHSELVRARKGSSFSLGSFIDPSFRNFITPTIVSIIWIFVLVIAGLVALGLIIGIFVTLYLLVTGGLRSGGAVLILMEFMYLCVLCFWLLMIRVILEGTVVIYNIYKTLLEIRDQGKS